MEKITFFYQIKGSQTDKSGHTPNPFRGSHFPPTPAPNKLAEKLFFYIRTI
jgi:hypothetical protein